MNTRIVAVSPAERRVLVEFMKDGADNDTIARRLRVHRDTVKTHFRGIFVRAQVSNRTALALGLERGELVLAHREQRRVPPPLTWDDTVNHRWHEVRRPTCPGAGSSA